MEAMSLLQMEMEPRQTTAVALCLLCATLSDSGQEFLSWILVGTAGGYRNIWDYTSMARLMLMMLSIEGKPCGECSFMTSE